VVGGLTISGTTTSAGRLDGGSNAAEVAEVAATATSSFCAAPERRAQIIEMAVAG
jgi:hypothetical protein